MKRSRIYLILMGLAFWGCYDDGFKKLDESVSYNILRFESDSAQIQHGDMCFFRLSTFTGDMDSLALYPRDFYVFVCDTTSRYWTRSLEGFSVGDSIVFNIHKRAFQVPLEEENIFIHVGIEWIMPLDLNSPKEKGSFEYALIDQYLMERGLNPMDVFFNGVYVVDLGPGSDLINRNDAIVLHNQIYLLNDSLIFDSEKENAPLYFNVGEEGQVVPGVEAALRIMSYDSHCEIVLPSSAAFGEDGSLQNGIEPYTPLRMVLSVKRQLSIPQE